MEKSSAIALFIAASLLSACGATPPRSPSTTTADSPGAQPTGGEAVGTTEPGAPTLTPQASPAPLPESRRQLIARALEEGRIDRVTSLEYRAQALFGLPGLPAEFAAAPSLFEDTGLFSEIVDALPDLSADDQARLRPFVARPTDPTSIFAGGGLPLAEAEPLAVAGSALGQPMTAAVQECRSWIDSGTASAHFKVWTCSSEAAADDASAVATVAGLLEGIWPAMTKPVPAGMGPPLPDGRADNPGAEFGGDRRIDVYVLTLEQGVFRSGYVQSVQDEPDDTAVAAAVPSEQFDGNRSSGFMLVDRGRIDGEIRNDLIHEFFHVLQYAHNRKSWSGAGADHWFLEASAVWSETWYGDSAEPHGWLYDFQRSPLSLEASDNDHDYADYIWPVFMQQELNSGAPIFKAWQQIDGLAAGDFKGMTNAVDAQLKFADRFRDFAVRNLNREILGQVTQPGPEKRHQSFDPDIPDDAWPVPVDSQLIELGTGTPSAGVSIPPLAARYLYYTVGGLARLVTIDLSGLSPSDSLDADLLVHVRDHWERVKVDGTKFSFCRDLPEGDINQLWLILSNHAQEGHPPIQGSVVTRALPCIGWAGTMTVTRNWTYSGGQQTGSATTTFNGVWVLDDNPQHYDYECQAASPPPDCPQIFLPTGTISWSFQAQCGDNSDGGSGSFEAGTGFAYPEFDWNQQAIYLRRTSDGTKFQYWGQGVMVGMTDQGEPYCGAGNSLADAERYFFEILEDAADRQPYPGTIQTCIGRAFEIAIDATAIVDTCRNRSVAGETDTVFNWNLQRVGDPSPGG